ncbi:MAG: agmatine deiminase AguA [Oceanicaulis sp. HLUCCA04]|nr:MAG: agmatine deiminase AguA [Oceanicaulis sp. HLUCCA04]
MTASLHIPHETAPQDVIHTCWPADGALWEDDLDPARAEFASFVSHLVRGGQAVTIHAASDETVRDVHARLGETVQTVRNPYGDVWVRDTGPVLAVSGGQLTAVRFRFNGWGRKYELDGDQQIGLAVASLAGARLKEIDLVCEGGALEFDGEGTLITTRQCLLNANRNPGLTEAQVEDRLKDALGIQSVIWLDEGLAGDHTDGHVDNIARFIAPGVVACQQASGSDDPNAKTFDAIARQLESARDAKARKLEVVRLPSPGRVVDEDGAVRAASHMNWVLAPRTVVMPAFNAHAAMAVKVLEPYFSGRTLAVSPSSHILSGGGSFHCVTCNQPRV